ncbi:MAG: extracellular solute-binding protein [Planctomycetaceae bacterium]|nr:MAG: extracellular solute-binding protein [Planctomycetaceae bacterium]
MRRCKVLICVLLLASLSLTLWAGGQREGAAAKKTPLRVLVFMGAEDPYSKTIRSMIEKFKADNADWLNLEVESAAGDDMKTKLRIDIAANNLADVFMYWGAASSIATFVDAGLVLDIQKYLDVSKNVKKEDFSSGAWSMYAMNGKVWGLPELGGIGWWACNKELFAKYGLAFPKTYEELLAVSKVFNENGIVPLAMGSKEGNPGHFFLSELACQRADGVKDMQDIYSTWKFDTPANRWACELIDDMRQNGVFPNDTVANGDWNPSFALYNNEKAAMVYTFTWMAGAMRPEIVEKTVLIPTPKMPGSTVDPNTFVSKHGNRGSMINAKSWGDAGKQKAIVAWMDFMASKYWHERILYEAGDVVVRQGIDIDEAKLPTMLANVLDYSSKREGMTNHWINFPHPKPWADCQNFLDELFAGSMTPDAYVKKIQESLDKTKAELGMK